MSLPGLPKQEDKSPEELARLNKKRNDDTVAFQKYHYDRLMSVPQWLPMGRALTDKDLQFKRDAESSETLAAFSSTAANVNVTGKLTDGIYEREDLVIKLNVKDGNISVIHDPDHDTAEIYKYTLDAYALCGVKEVVLDFPNITANEMATGNWGIMDPKRDYYLQEMRKGLELAKERGMVMKLSPKSEEALAIMKMKAQTKLNKNPNNKDAKNIIKQVDGIFELQKALVAKEKDPALIEKEQMVAADRLTKDIDNNAKELKKASAELTKAVAEGDPAKIKAAVAQQESKMKAMNEDIKAVQGEIKNGLDENLLKRYQKALAAAKPAMDEARKVLDAAAAKPEDKKETDAAAAKPEDKKEADAAAALSRAELAKACEGAQKGQDAAAKLFDNVMHDVEVKLMPIVDRTRELLVDVGDKADAVNANAAKVNDGKDDAEKIAALQELNTSLQELEERKTAIEEDSRVNVDTGSAQRYGDIMEVSKGELAAVVEKTLDPIINDPNSSAELKEAAAETKAAFEAAKTKTEKLETDLKEKADLAAPAGPGH